VAGLTVTVRDRNQRIADVFRREQSRLRHFIRRRVPDPRDAEDILQDVFYKLVEANQLLMPIDHVAAWLFRVARNRITDLLRKKQPVLFSDVGGRDEDVEVLFEDFLASSEAGPDVVYARQVLMEELEAAIADLPPDQRAVFVAHELEGRAYEELAAASGVNVNTLLSRKRYAVLRLRERLREVYEEWRDGL
jgi:RNA polymerase sigma factor (sigma-70 family)